MKLDHIVQLTENLDQAVSHWMGMGFTVSPGGVHADGLTHNALVIFRDGSYVELVAFRSREVDDTTHRWARYRGVWGPVDYAFAVPNVADYATQLKIRGLPYTDARDGGRERPDGVTLHWRSTNPADQSLGLPFFLEDLTEREKRVPTLPDNTGHNNGASGITEVHVAVRNIEIASKQFQAIFGNPYAAITGSRTTYALEGGLLVVTPFLSGSSPSDFVSRRGAGPLSFTIAAPTPIVIKPSGLKPTDLPKTQHAQGKQAS